MSRLTELKNEDATALIADIIEPASVIFADTEVKEKLKDSKIAAIKYVMKNHGTELIDILALLDGVPRDEFKVNAVQIVQKTFALLNDPDLMSVFYSQAQTAES